MQTSLDKSVLDKVTYLTGDADITEMLRSVPAKVPFDEKIISFLNDVSRELMSNREAKAFSDIVTFAFWIRKSSTFNLKERFEKRDGYRHLGKGVVFHVAPSNVPVNFAYSLVAGLLNGNANIVRIPSKGFPQVDILVDAFNKALSDHEEMRPYILLVRYGRDKEINDLFSSIADMRVIWGGDKTIADLRRSPLPPRSGEITFADRYSIAVIDSDTYLASDDKDKIAEDFYNDTFFSDQNACTSPRVIIWTGTKINEAKEQFWSREHSLVAKKYTYQPIQGVNKLIKAYIAAVAEPGIRVENHQDNLIIRVTLPEITDTLMNYCDNSGYFYEYECKDIMEIKVLCNDKRCQTIAYIGDSEMLEPLVLSGVKGIDRVVSMGKTMDFDLIWDGYDLPSMLSRTIVM